MTARAARPRALSLFALPGIPMVQPGDDLAALIADGFARAGEAAAAGDVLVVAQKIVSKSEGRYANLAEVEPGAEARGACRARRQGPAHGRADPERVAQGWCAIGPGSSSWSTGWGSSWRTPASIIPTSSRRTRTSGVLLLPRDPDGSAQRLREGLRGPARHGLRRDRQRQCRPRMAGGHRGPRAGRRRVAVPARSQRGATISSAGRWK